VTKEDFRICLENWLDQLKGLNDGKFADIEGANKIAKDLSLTGHTKDASLELSDPPDNTRAAPWVWGLSIVLLKAVAQFNQNQEPTALMPWIFIPDGQAFHFFMTARKVSSWSLSPNAVLYTSENGSSSTVFKTLVPEPDLRLLRGKYVSFEAVYVRHNRDNPTRKSEVNDIADYKDYGLNLFAMSRQLRFYPWLRNYVKFGKTMLGQLLDESEQQLGRARDDPEEVKTLNGLKVWIEKELEEYDK